MENGKKPKWDIGVAANAGSECHALMIKYRVDLEPRLQPDEIDQHGANAVELEKRRSGQTEVLNVQKTNTKGKEGAEEELHNTAISIRNMVKSNNASQEILQAYGVGEKIPTTMTGTIAAGNMVIMAYNTYTEWSNKVGIIEADITQVSELIKDLSSAGGKKEDSVFNRKAQTMDKNVLHRAVEDEVTRISALGAHVFRTKNPAVAALFEGLIPNSPKEKPQAQPETQKSA